MMLRAALLTVRYKKAIHDIDDVIGDISII